MIIANTDAELFAAVKDGQEKIQVMPTATSSVNRTLSYAASQRSNKKILGIALIVVGFIVSAVLANALGGSILATLCLVAIVAIVVAIIMNTGLGRFVRRCGEVGGTIGTVVGVLILISLFGLKLSKVSKVFGSRGDFAEILIVYLLPLIPLVIFLFAGAYFLFSLPKEYNVVNKEDGSILLISKDCDATDLSDETGKVSDCKPCEEAAVTPTPVTPVSPNTSNNTAEEQDPLKRITLKKKVSESANESWQTASASTSNSATGYASQPSYAYNADNNLPPQQTWQSTQQYENGTSFNFNQKPRFSSLLTQLFYEFWGNYANFRGRTARADFWLTNVFLSLVSFLYFIPVVALPLLGCYSTAVTVISFAAAIVFGLAIVVPALSITVRRLHDTGKSGLWILVSLVPFVGSIILLVLLVLEGQNTENKWGAPIDRNAVSPASDPQVRDSQKKWTIGMASVTGFPVLIFILGLIIAKTSGYGGYDYDYDDYYSSSYSDYDSSDSYSSSSSSSSSSSYSSGSSSSDSYSSSSSSSNHESSASKSAPVYRISNVDNLPSDGFDGWYNSVQYIDLGLPSGIQWADRNVGATNPYSSGSYFTHSAGSFVCYQFYEGAVNIPSQENFQELKRYCTWKWEGKGYRITSKRNGNSIYLPAAGNYKGTQLRKSGTDGDYWAGNTVGSSRGANLDFTSKSITTDDSSPVGMYFTVRLIAGESECSDCD